MGSATSSSATAVAEIAAHIEVGGDVEVVDVAGKVVTPGFIDIHVHLREPGQEHKETVETGTRAAAAGGFTAVACMANTHPVNDTVAVTEHILSQARRYGYARVYPVAAVSKGLEGEELAEIGQLRNAGCVAISDDGRPVRSSELMRRALSYARHFALPLVQHAQDMDLSGEGAMHEGVWSTRLGVPAIPGAAEDAMVARDLLLVELTGGRYHLQHTSTARSLELIRDGKRRGLDVTCEVTPHHLFLTDEEVAKTGLSTNTKMNPPLRSERDREALVAGLADGSVDVIATDHAPHHVDEKRVPFAVAPFGIVGLETAVGLCLDRLVRPGPDRSRAPGRSAVVWAGARDGCARRDPRARQPRRRHRARPRRRLEGRAAAVPEQVAQHAVRRVVGEGRARR